MSEIDWMRLFRATERKLLFQGYAPQAAEDIAGDTVAVVLERTRTAASTDFRFAMIEALRRTYGRGDSTQFEARRRLIDQGAPIEVLEWSSSEKPGPLEYAHNCHRFLSLMRKATPREREVIALFCQGWTQGEIASRLGVSKPRVSYILRRYAKGER